MTNVFIQAIVRSLDEIVNDEIRKNTAKNINDENVNSLTTLAHVKELISRNMLIYPTRLAASLETIPENVRSIITLGYREVGDGGHAIYCTGLPNQPGGFSSNNQRNWNLANNGEVSILCFGAIAGDAGGTNASINNNAITEALIYNNASTITFPAGAFEISQTIRLNKNNDAIKGIAANPVFGTVQPHEGTVFRWYGPNTDPVINVGSTGIYDVLSPSLMGVSIDCRNNAAIGLRVVAVQKPIIDNIHVFNMQSGIAYFFGYGEATSGINCVYQGSIGSITAFVDGTAIGIVCDNHPSGLGQNVTFTTFKNVHITWKNGIGIYLRGMDDCLFDVVGFSRMAGGTGDAIVIEAPPPNRFVVGNTFNTVNCSVTDGPAARIISQGSGARGNIFLHVTGVDHRPDIIVTNNSELHYYFSGSGYSANLEVEKPLFRIPPLRITGYENSDPNVLDWYQEYVFTPQLLIGGSATGITYNNRQGRYTRIGNIITGSLSIYLSNKGSSTGNLSVIGMPLYGTDAVFMLRAITGFLPAAIERPVASVQSNNAFILLKTPVGGGGMDIMTDQDITNNAAFTISFAFTIAN